MTTKEMIAVMTAYDEGKEIQMKPKGGSEWYKAINPNWDWLNLDYRIKPEESQPKYRPYANAKELDEAIKEHGIWVKGKDDDCRIIVDMYNNKYVTGMLYELAFEKFTWLDGTPFGIKEE